MIDRVVTRINVVKFAVNIVYECLVDESCAARRGLVAGEVPVARMVGTSLVQSLDALEHQFDGCLHIFWAQHFHDFLVDFLDGKGLVERTNVVFIEH